MSLSEWKDVFTIVGVFVAIATLIKALLEFTQQARKKRAEAYMGLERSFWDEAENRDLRAAGIRRPRACFDTVRHEDGILRVLRGSGAHAQLKVDLGRVRFPAGKWAQIKFSFQARISCGPVFTCFCTFQRGSKPIG
jgi:hypothetical protein